MEQIQGSGVEANKLQSKASFAPDSSDQSQLKSEYMLLQRKYERLEAKEKRIQVGQKINKVLL